MPARSRWSTWLFLAVTLFVFPLVAASAASSKARFFDAASQAAEFIEYNRSIALTAEQKAFRGRALESIPAPCCGKFSMATCCCPCNFAKSVWGLTNTLIVREHASAAEIRKAVMGWIAFVNPKGFTGDACDSAGGCGRNFSKNGCGGMDERDLHAAR